MWVESLYQHCSCLYKFVFIFRVEGIMNYVAFGRRVRQLRRSLHWTQAQLAQTCGISISVLGHIERGSRKASLQTLLELCSVLGINPDHLLEDSLDAFAEQPDDGAAGGLNEGAANGASSGASPSEGVEADSAPKETPSDESALVGKRSEAARSDAPSSDEAFGVEVPSEEGSSDEPSSHEADKAGSVQAVGDASPCACDEQPAQGQPDGSSWGYDFGSHAAQGHTLQQTTTFVDLWELATDEEAANGAAEPPDAPSPRETDA